LIYAMLLGAVRSVTRRALDDARELRGLALEHELVAEQRRPRGDRQSIKSAEHSPHDTPTAQQDLQRESGRFLPDDAEAGALEAPPNASPSKEADVTAIEHASLVVVEQSEGCAPPGVPMAEIRDRSDEQAPRHEQVAQLRKHLLGFAQMLQDICRQHDIVGTVLGDLRRKTPVQVGLNEAIDAVAHTRHLKDVDGGDLVP
jgi:hypothetical protein